jgi:hypothetical protein
MGNDNNLPQLALTIRREPVIILRIKINQSVSFLMRRHFNLPIPTLRDVGIEKPVLSFS